jgi:hypothetical protein
VINPSEEVAMSQFLLFLIEVGICLGASGILVIVLTRPLRRLLIDACGTRERANFWVVYCNAMIFIAPLVASVVFGKSGELFAPTVAFYKAALGSALSGIFVALAAIGLQVARILPPRMPTGDPKREGVAASAAQST